MKPQSLRQKCSCRHNLEQNLAPEPPESSIPGSGCHPQTHHQLSLDARVGLFSGFWPFCCSLFCSLSHFHTCSEILALSAFLTQILCCWFSYSRSERSECLTAAAPPSKQQVFGFFFSSSGFLEFGSYLIVFGSFVGKLKASGSEGFLLLHQIQIKEEFLKWLFF